MSSTRSSTRGAIIVCAGLVAALADGCGDGGGGGDDPEVIVSPEKDAGMPAAPDGSTGNTVPVSFAQDVQPIFQRCVICHRPGGIIDLDLTHPFDPVHGLIDRPNSWHEAHDSPLAVLVEPGDPDASFLIYKVAADPDPAHFDTANNGDPMPLHMPRVTAAELADIKRWISDGAHDDAFFAANVAPIFGTEITLGRKRGKCTYCHYPDSSTGMNVLAVFDDTHGLVGAPSVFSDKLRVAPGSPEDSFLVEKLEQEMPSAGQQMPLHYPRLTPADVATLRAWIEQGAKND